MTQKQAIQQIKNMGLSVKIVDREYEVEGYFTDDAQDAVDTARIIAAQKLKERNDSVRKYGLKSFRSKNICREIEDIEDDVAISEFDPFEEF